MPQNEDGSKEDAPLRVEAPTQWANLHWGVGSINPPAYSGQQPQVFRAEATFHSGTLPPASELREYEEASSGSAKWIMEEAAKNSQHVRDMERGALRIAQSESLLRQVLPALAVLSFLASSVIIAVFSNTTVGLIGFATTIAGVIIAYLKRGFFPSAETGDFESPPEAPGEIEGSET
jgi:uncharacterized membrane protein